MFDIYNRKEVEEILVSFKDTFLKENYNLKISNKEISNWLDINHPAIPYDSCVLCGKISPYTELTHIDYRIGYVEGSGQGCFTPNSCDKI